jgi:hypothetical protein
MLLVVDMSLVVQFHIRRVECFFSVHTVCYIVLQYLMLDVASSDLVPFDV